MYKIEKVIETRTIDKLVEIICNMCGETCLNDAYHHINYWGGYNSIFPGDGLGIELDLCEKCLCEISNKCKHRVTENCIDKS